MLFRRLSRAGILATFCTLIPALFTASVSFAQKPKPEVSPKLPPLSAGETCRESDLPFPWSRTLLSTLERDADPFSAACDSSKAPQAGTHSAGVPLSAAAYHTCDRCPYPSPSRYLPPPVASVRSASNKQKEAILEMRDRVLGILREDNACSAWYRERDPDAAEVFSTLGFELDRKGQEFVSETRDTVFRFLNPWVAKVMQDGGPYQTVTVNLGGAFFRMSAYVRVFPVEGGPAMEAGARTLRVGPFMGGTPEAQLTTLLHELGHAIGLLEFDADDVASKSAHNTELVVGHCQSQILNAGKKARSPGSL